MRSKLIPLVKLWYSPAQAISDLASGAPYLTGGLLAFVSSFLYGMALKGELTVLLSAARGELPAASSWIVIHLLSRFMASVGPLLFLTVVFVPTCLFVANLLDRRSSFGVLLRQEYGPFVSSVLYSWAASHLMMLIIASVTSLATGWSAFEQPGPVRRELDLALNILPLPYFLFLVAVALRVVLRLSYKRALGGVALAALALLALPLLPKLLFAFTSPFLLILLFFVLRNFFSDMLGAQQAREQFKQSMEAATLNPADASAHYNLGLLHQRHGHLEEAKECFQRAISIDPEETDSHYQLGRIAREMGELPDAIAHFEAVVTRNPEHSQNEVWREIGCTYYQAGQFEDARSAFERFLAARESDAEGRYHYALTLHKLGRVQDAATQMEACIETVRTSPAFKYRAEKRWMNDARAFLRSQSGNR
jgi:tetratricopeptide (TPR) repeat protein